MHERTHRASDRKHTTYRGRKTARVNKSRVTSYDRIFTRDHLKIKVLCNHPIALILQGLAHFSKPSCIWSNHLRVYLAVTCTRPVTCSAGCPPRLARLLEEISRGQHPSGAHRVRHDQESASEQRLPVTGDPYEKILTLTRYHV